MSAFNKNPSLCVEITHAEGIKDTQMFAPQDPYAIVTLLPSGTQERTRHVAAGGTDPKWNASHGNQLLLALAEEDTRVKIELWNLNTFVDDLIGSIELDLKIALCQDGRYKLDTGGKVCCAISKHQEEVQREKEESAKEQFRGAHYETEETEDKPVAATVMVDLVCTAGPALDNQAPDPLMETKQCVVQLGIVDLSTNKLFTCGSGSIVHSNGYIVTAAHVVMPALTAQQECMIVVGVWVGEGTPAEWRYTATVKSDKAVLAMKTPGGSLLDIALLKINRTVQTMPRAFQGLNKRVIIKGQAPFQGSLRFLEHSISAPATGEQVCIFGYPKGTSTSDFGLKAHGATASISSGGEYIQVDSVNVAASGASGGPLLNKSGQVVGVLSMDYNDARGQKRIAKIGGTNLSYFRPLSFLEAGHHMPKDKDSNQSLVVKPPKEDMLEAIEHAHKEDMDAHQRTQGKVDSLVPLIIQGVRALGGVQPAEATAEEKAIAGEILMLLTSSQSRQLVEGRQHIKAGNVEQAHECFQQVFNQKLASPEELAKAKKLLMYTLFKLGIKHLQDHKYDQAAERFEEILKQRLDNFPKERLQKLRIFHACALYEAGKQHRAKGNLGEAKKRFEAAKEAEALPAELKTKVDRYLEEYNTNTAVTPRSALPAVPIRDWLSLLGPKYAEYAESFEAYGYGDSNDLADADVKDLEDAWEELAVTKKPHQKRILKALQGLKRGNSPGMSAFKDGKRALREGNLNLALQLFQGAQKDPMLSSSADKYIARVKQSKTGNEATASVFSDNCTHILGSSTMATGLFTITLELATKTVSTSLGAANNRELVMVLDEKFPENSTKRASLILALKVDIRKALKLVSDTADMEIIDLARGSIIVHFRFVDDGGKATKIEEEYWRQVDDKESLIYKGEVTRKIDQERTTKLTMQLNESRGRLQACPYQVGDTITLAQITQDEKIECKVDAKLGEGTTATVFKVTTNNKARALKVFKAKKSLEDLCEEASLMLTSSHPDSHPNVLRADFVWYEQRTNEMFFLLEQTWMDDERLYAGTDAELEERLILIVHQLACGLQHYHLRGILHEDFKPDNVLMTRTGVPVIGDLGVGNVGTIVNGKVKAMLRGGTPVYASPNVRKLFFQAKALPVAERKDFLQQHPITHLDDFFALGATILDMFAECGWRRGHSVADVLASSGSVDKLVANTKLMRVVVPEGMMKVLQTCFSADDSLTVDSIVELTGKLCEQPPPSTVKGMLKGRYANIRNNLGVALYDSGAERQKWGNQGDAIRHFGAAHTQLEHAITAQPDNARTLNNLGVIKWAQGMVNEARQHFDAALAADPEHAAAVSNVALVQKRREGRAQLDRTGAAGAVEDNHDEVELARAVSFAPGQPLEVYRCGRWERINTGGRVSEKSLIDLTYRLPVPQAAPKYAPQQRLLIHEDREWRLRQAQHMQDSTLEPTNHAPALFVDLAAMSRAQQAHIIELKDKHAFILDLFSGKELSVRTQTAALRYYEKECAAQILSRDDDTDAPKYQVARQKSLELVDSVTAHTLSENENQQREALVMNRSKDAVTILQEMLGGADRTPVRLRRYLLLILGPAASGKTTLLKTFMMEMVDLYPDFVPVLMPIIEVVRVLDTCNRDEGESMVTSFIRRIYPQHAHLLLQMKFLRRAVFLVDGIDESGTHREAVQDFITVELLEPGHKTIITSRHSGFSSDAFKQCLLVELLPLSAEQQAEMVCTRVLDDKKAAELVKELGTVAFKDIASNPLMLTMMVSVYVSNNFVVISNRSELYEKALRTLMGRTDKNRAGLELAVQEEMLAHLQRLASASHRREGERRIFTAAQASEWAGSNGWVAIEGAMQDGRLPIIIRLGPNDKDEEEYRFGHMSYQEYLTGREYYRKLTESHFSADTMVELFGQEPRHAFADAKYHLVLELLAGILSPAQRSVCLAVMAGGRVEIRKGERGAWRRISTLPYQAGWRWEGSLMSEVARWGFGPSVVQCAANGCSELHQNVDGFCHNHRADAAMALAEATAVRGGDTLTITNRLQHAGAEALAPFVRENTRLRTLTLPKIELGDAGMRVLADALQTNSTLTALDVSENELRTQGAKHIAAAIPECKALASVNILNNDIGSEQANELITIMASKPGLKTLCGFSGDETKLDLSNKGLSAGCAVLVANEVKNNGALTSLNISSNGLARGSLKQDARSDYDKRWGREKDVVWGSKDEHYESDMTGVIALADGIKNNGALEKLLMAGNEMGTKAAGEALGQALAQNSVLKELDVSRNTYWDGNKRGTDPGFASGLADGLKNNGALVKFDISNNLLRVQGTELLASALKDNKTITELNIADNRITSDGKSLGHMSGVIAISDAIPTMGALASLDLSRNVISESEISRITALCEAKGISLKV